MSVETAKVRFTRPYMAYKAGQVATVTKGVAHSLARFGKAELVCEPQMEFATAPEPAGLELAIAPAAKAAKRGRRKKQT